MPSISDQEDHMPLEQMMESLYIPTTEDYEALEESYDRLAAASRELLAELRGGPRPLATTGIVRAVDRLAVELAQRPDSPRERVQRKLAASPDER
jgi:hypothetical protein